MNEASIWPLRSMLFVPAHRPDFVAKVPRFAPDSVVLDLEDAVPPQHKIAARDHAREAMGFLRGHGIPAFVRINALDQGGLEDAIAVAAEGYAGVMLPKAATAQEVQDLDAALGFAEGRAGLPFRSVAIMPLPETAVGMCDARALAAASPRVRGLIGVVGGPIIGDVARAAGFRPTREGTEQVFLACKIVLESRAAGAMHPMGSLIGTALDDHAHVRTLAQRALQYGYTGAVLIHPSHVAIAHEVFTPTREEAEHFAGMIDAMRDAEAKGVGAVSYRGQMVDYAMIPHAEDLVRAARRFGVLPA
ncbi:CoA ester lyase [Roseomonas sp. AR75]|jgi:citrate lyase subunit beta/citryl-CoA lyase|uniref:HpcH/HpaI aldolase/citrate lyase family protein n=1 Tax=Roseomonas sp. AR75 TaxID=2562311 RepID=UPI0010BF9291|nr:CoA ester lyase [Roseomonas sp. AR75]